MNSQSIISVPGIGACAIGTLLTLMATASVLSGCATANSSKSFSLTYLAHATRARNDLIPKEIVAPDATLGREISGTGIETADFPPSYAVQCNPSHSDCKHAIVKTHLEFSVHQDGNGRLAVSGTLLSEMGRSVLLRSPPALQGSSMQNSMVTTMSIPDSVSVIDEIKVPKHFDQTIAIGELLEIEGLFGVKVSIKFENRHID